MRCTRCGSVDDTGPRFCRRCGALLLPRSALAALVPAFSTGPAIPAVAAICRDLPQALVAALPGGAQPLLPAMASASRPQRLLPAGGPAEPPHHSALATGLVAGGGLVALSATLFVAAQLALPPLRLADWIPEAPSAPPSDVGESLQPEPPAANADASSQPEAAPAPGAAPGTIDLHALEGALNAELQRAGLNSVVVRLDADGRATARGPVDSEADRRMVMDWLRGHDGIVDVHDQLRLAVPEPPAVPVVPVPPPEQPAQPPRRPAPPAVDRPPAAAAPARPRNESAASPRGQPATAPAIAPATAPAPASPVESRPPVAEARPPAPDAATVTRGVQRELARLGLDDVAVAVDPATLVVTLRGRTRDAARKAEALAAARAAAPGSRVRDLVFVIEE